MTTIAANDPQALPWALEALERGAPVAIPTDTVYGLAARLDRPGALERLYAVKGRPPDRAIPVLISDADLLSELTVGMPGPTEEFAARFWPGPLTIVLPRGKAVPDLVTAGGDTVGLRMPAHPFALALIEGCGGALAVTSANRSGQPDLSDPVAVEAALGEEVELIVDSGRTPGGRPSTVIRLTDAGPTVLRAGALGAAALRAAWDELSAASV
jgi:L-threonylcarbamoyladenylate synthase